MPHAPSSSALPSEASPVLARDQTVAELTLALTRGDESAWAAFHERYRLRLLGYLSRLWQGEAVTVDDLLQETLVRAVRHMRVFPDEEQLWSWLTVLARSAVVDCGRRRSRHWRFLQRWRLESELRNLPTSSEEVGDLLILALAKLDPEPRQLLEDKYLHRLPVRQLAQARGLTEKAVEARLARARKQLSKHLRKP